MRRIQHDGPRTFAPQGGAKLREYRRPQSLKSFFGAANLKFARPPPSGLSEFHNRYAGSSPSTESTRKQHERGIKMRMKVAATALLITQCLSACGPGGVGGLKGPGLFRTGPSESELTQALQTRHPGHPIIAAKLDQCQEGRVDEKAVQVCGFCFVAVGVAYSGNILERGAYLKTVRRSGSVVFRRAISADQPGVEPAPGQRGVWLASSIRHDTRVVSAPLTDQLMRRAGHDRRPGFGTLVKWTMSSDSSLGPLGEVAEPVAGAFVSDARLRSETADLVGACGRAGGQWNGRPPASNRPVGSNAKAQ